MVFVQLVSSNANCGNSSYQTRATGNSSALKKVVMMSKKETHPGVER